MTRRADGPPGAGQDVAVDAAQDARSVKSDGFGPKNDHGAAGRVWRLVFQGMPPGPNDLKKMKVRERMRWSKLWRWKGDQAVKHTGIPPLGRVRLSATFRRRALGVADEDNDRARLKHICDSLVLRGVVPKDTRRYVTWGPVTEERGEPGVTLVVEEVL